MAAGGRKPAPKKPAAKPAARPKRAKPANLKPKPAAKGPDDLDLKRQTFVREYLVDLNATQAAIRAGYSAKTAAQQAVRLLGDARIQAAIQEQAGKRAERLEVTADNIVAELAKIGFASMGRLVDEESGQLNLGRATKDNAAALAVKRAALVDLGRHLQIFTDKLKLENGDDGPFVYKRVDASGEPGSLAND